MKKLMTMALALVMVVTMTGVGYAANPIITNQGTDTHTVTAKISTADEADVYSVDITWDNLAFETTSATKTWDPVTHTYSVTDAVWSGAQTVTVTNHSNVGVTVTPSVTGSPVKGVTANVSEAFDLTRGVVNETAGVSGTFTVGVSGDKPAGDLNGDVVGTVEVKIQKN